MQSVSEQGGQNAQPGPAQRRERRRELRVFLFLTILLAPILAIMIVGGYGFLVWFYQLLAGPPGPPG